MRGRSLRTYLVTVNVGLLLVFGTLIGVLGYNNAISGIDQSTNRLIEWMTLFSTNRIQDTVESAGEISEILSASASTINNEEVHRLNAVPIMIESLEQGPDFVSIYVGNAEGDFLLVRRMPDDETLQANFNAPEGTAYIAQSLDRWNERIFASRYLYFDAAAFLIGAEDRPSYVEYDPRRRGWYREAIQATSTITTNPYVFFTTHQIGMTVATPAEGIGSHLGAVVGVDFTLDGIRNLVSGLQLGSRGSAVLIAQDGSVIAHSEIETVVPDTSESGADTVRQLQAEELPNPGLPAALDRFRQQGTPRVTSVVDDVTWEYAFASIPLSEDNSLTLALTVERADLMSRAYDLLKTGGIFFAFLLLCSTLAIILVAQFLSRPLSKLQENTEAVMRFEFEETEPVRTNISDIQHLADSIESMKDTIRRFLEISSAIAAEKDFDRLSERLLDEIIATTHTEAGILYLRSDDGERLIPHVGRLDKKRDLIFPASDILLTQRDTLVVRSARDENAEGAEVNEHELKLMGLNGIGDAMDEAPAHLLAAPLFNRQNYLVGVMLLFETSTLDQALVRFTEAMVGSAAISLEARQLIAEQKELFESFIQLIASAIDAKSPYTGGHCARVPELTKMLAGAAEETTEGPFADFTLNPEDWEAIHVAAWLHDCGKVTTPEYVVDKATKLETIYDRIHEIRMRFEVLKRDVQVDYYRRVAEEGDSEAIRAERDAALTQLDDDFAFIAECNEGGEFMSDEKVDRIRQIATRTWTRTLDDRIGISHEEKARKDREPARPLPAKEPLLADRADHLFPRPESETLAENNPWGFKMDVPELLYNRGEVHNLTIRRGTLTDEDRYKINEHIVQTIKMLDQLPFPRHLNHVPELAGGHHEKMDGTGYPKRLKGTDMSPVARMMAIADIFEALTAVDRPYKKGKTLSEALRIMTFMVKDAHVDADLFDLFLTSGVYRLYAERFMEPQQIDEVDIDDYRPGTEAA